MTEAEKTTPAEPTAAASTPEPAPQVTEAPAALPKPSEDPSHLVVKVTSYVDNRGRQIDDRELVWGDLPEGFVRFSGLGDVAFRYPNGQTKTQTTRFPLPGAADLKAAFDAYDAAFDIVHVETQKQFDEHLAKLEKQMEEQRKEAAKEAIAAGRGPGWRPPGGIIRPR